MRFDVGGSLIISLDLDVLRFGERSLWDYFFLREGGDGAPGIGETGPRGDGGEGATGRRKN